MVLFKIAIVAAAFAGLLVLAKNDRWFERAGLMSSCQVSAAPYGARTAPGGQWWVCREGAISGFPSLVRDHCDSKGFVGRTQLWYCPQAIDRPS